MDSTKHKSFQGRKRISKSLTAWIIQFLIQDYCSWGVCSLWIIRK